MCAVAIYSASYRKGIGLIFPNLREILFFLWVQAWRIDCGNANEHRDVGQSPWKSSLFLLTNANFYATVESD